MKLAQDKQRDRKYLALAFALPSVGMLFVMMISGYEPFGKYSMLYSDMYHQYYPFFVEFRRALRSGDGLLYTWSVGLGMDYLGLISYYLASPLNLLSVFVPEDLLLEFFSLLVPIKLGLAGLFFAIFLKELFRKNDFSIAVFGGLYGLCAWGLGFQWNIMWVDTFALLPLVVLGTVYLLRDKKFLLYTIALFQSIFSNYYIGFFTCIFVFLLFFVYEICRWGGWKKFFGDFFRIAFFSLLAIGMTAILELPAFAALQTTQSSVNKFPTTFRLNIASEHTLTGLLDAMRQVIGNMGGALEPNFKEGLPNLYCGIFSIFLMMLYLQAEGIRLRDKICAVALLLFFNVSFIIRQLDYIWHGFHFTNMIPYRFSFLYSFVVLYMAYQAWLLRKKFQPIQIITSGLFAGAVLTCSKELTETVPVDILSFTVDFPVYLIYNSVFLLLYVGIMLYGAADFPVSEDAGIQEIRQARKSRATVRRRTKALALALICVELVANLVCFGLYFPGTGVSNYPKGTEKTASVIRYMFEREDDNLFFRAETTHSQTLNDGALNGYQGVSTFTSSANVKVTEFMKSLGYAAKNTYNRYLFEESSPVSNLFIGLKYMLERDGKDKSSTFFMERNRFGDTVLLENQAYLPLGFLAEEELSEFSFASSGNSFQFQNELFHAATGVQEDVWSKLEGENLTISGNNATIATQNASGYCQYSSTANNATVSYYYVADRDGFMCVYLNLPKRNDFWVNVNGVDLYRETISLPQMFAVGDVKTGDHIEIRVICDNGEESTMTVNAALLDYTCFQRGYDILNASTLELTSFKSTRVEGTIQCNRNGLLYASIPQNGNWYVTVDGEEAETLTVGDCMIGVPLTAGEHHIIFTYRNAAFSLGWKISLACSLLFLLFVQIYYKPDWKVLLRYAKRKGKYQK